MARRVRLTVFSRFILVLIILVPAAFIGASYLNNQDPFETVKSWIDGTPITSNNTEQIAPAPSTPTTDTNNDLATENQRLRERVQQLEQEVERLKAAAGEEKVGFE